MTGEIEKEHSFKRVAYILVTLAIIVLGLVYGRPFLVPIAIALLISIVVGAGADRLRALKVPDPFATLCSVAILVIAIFAIYNVITGQVDAVMQEWPRYVQRFYRLSDEIFGWGGREINAKLNEAADNPELLRQLPSLLGTAGGVLATFVLVAVYVGFLLFEREKLAGKLDLIFSRSPRGNEIRLAFTDISESVRRYLWIKTLMGLLTGAVSYAVLKILGVDFAETWALIIFLLNYIPSIGSALGVIFPALLALMQFDTSWQFMVIVVLLASAQFLIGNVLEPHLMGRTLNISPFTVIASLAFWSMVWGVVGAFLSIPMTTVLVIVCSHVRSLQWLAILLSADGRAVVAAPPLDAPKAAATTE